MTRPLDPSCAVARTLDVVGDWWSLLIVRDALRGKRRFGEFQKSLGVAKNILSTRLAKLVDEGVLEQVPAADGSAFLEYGLTPKGESLRVVLVALWQWGDAHCFEKGENPRALIDTKTGRRLARLTVPGSTKLV